MTTEDKLLLANLLEKATMMQVIIQDNLNYAVNMLASASKEQGLIDQQEFKSLQLTSVENIEADLKKRGYTFETKIVGGKVMYPKGSIQLYTAFESFEKVKKLSAEMNELIIQIKQKSGDELNDVN